MRDNRNDTDVLIRTYEGRIEKHKTKIRELRKLKKQLKGIDSIYNRAKEVEQEIKYRKEAISDYRYDIRHLKKLLIKEASK